MKQWIVNLFTSEGSNFPTSVSTIATLKVQVMLKLFSEKKKKKKITRPYFFSDMAIDTYVSKREASVVVRI